MSEIDVYHIEIIPVSYDSKIDDAYWQAQVDLCELIATEMGKKFHMPDANLVQYASYGLSIGGYYRIPSAKLSMVNIWLSSMLRRAGDKTGFSVGRVKFVIFDNGFDMKGEV